MADTIFSKIIRKEIPATIVFEDESVLAFRDISPQAPVHIIIIPKKEIATLNDIESADTQVLGLLIARAAQIAKMEGIDESGYRLVMNCNADGGQSVFHIHCHLLGGRALAWPPG